MAYSISTAFAIYFVIWWVTLFLTLPFGVRSQHEDGQGAPGTDPGAPVMAKMGRKLIWTTVISAVIFGAGMWAYQAGYLSVDLGFRDEPVMLRSFAGLTIFLIAFAGSAAAMDPSAMEETNCLMACDANQENCGATGHSSGKHRSAPNQLRETRPSRSLRPAANFSQIEPGALAKERLR